MEFHYFGSAADSVEIIDAILGQTKLSIIQHMAYSNKCVKVYHSLDNELSSLIKNRAQFYLWNENMYNIFPLDFGVYPGGKGYYIKPSPSLNITFPGFIENKENDRIRCINGILTHSKQIFNSITGEVIPVQSEVLNQYKEVLKIIKSRLVKVKGKNIWIGKEATNYFKNGELEICYSGKWLTGIEDGV